jgi:hypothetical protein
MRHQRTVPPSAVLPSAAAAWQRASRRTPPLPPLLQRRAPLPRRAGPSLCR